jgi:hypothetical protein
MMVKFDEAGCFTGPAWSCLSRSAHVFWRLIGHSQFTSALALDLWVTKFLSTAMSVVIMANLSSSHQ